MSDTICPDCGERNAGRVEFCSACGAYIAWDGQPEPEPPRPAHNAPAPVPAAAPPRPAAQSYIQPPVTPAPAATPTPAPVPSAPVAQPATRSWVGPPPPVIPSPAQWAGQAVDQYVGPPHRQAAPPAYPPPPAQSAAPPGPPPPTEGPCPRCGVVNDAELRFCRKCGLSLRGPVLQDDGARSTPPPERLPWWRKWFRPAENTRRAARAAYRHSMPLRYRMMRWVWGLLGLGAIVGVFYALGQNPVAWVQNQIANFQNSLVQVAGLQAVAEPADPNATENTAQNALDNLSDTAWTTTWTQASQLNPANAPCLSPSTPSAAGAPGSIVIIPSGPTTVREISIAAGLSKGDARRLQEWRPKTVQLAFSDGTCQQISLADNETLQQVKIEPVETTQIRVSIVDAYPPLPDQPIDTVAITDIRLFERP